MTEFSAHRISAEPHKMAEGRTDERVEREPHAARLDAVGVAMAEPADRVQLHHGAGHAGEEAQLQDAAGGLVWT
jgi:hypothetical protein